MIDGGVPDTWPEPVTLAMARFAQGDLLERPPFAYSRAAAYSVWSGDLESGVEGVGDMEHVRLASPRAEYGIITTQTCDVVDPSRDHPWIHVAPVYRVPGDYKPKGYFHRLTSNHLSDGIWVADLRLEVPLEKSVLVDRDPIPAFADEPDAIAFALALGRRRDRAALHDHINDILYAAWDRKITNNRPRARRLLPAVYSVRLAIASGTRRAPLAVQVHFISRPGLGGFADDTQEWLESWWDATAPQAREALPALNLLRNRYHDGGSLDVSLYDRLIPLDWLRQS